MKGIGDHSLVSVEWSSEVSRREAHINSQLAPSTAVTQVLPRVALVNQGTPWPALQDQCCLRLAASMATGETTWLCCRVAGEG